jgi:hypothetical protein
VRLEVFKFFSAKERNEGSWMFFATEAAAPSVFAALELVEFI